MATQVAKRFAVKTEASVFKRLGRVNHENISRNHQVKNVVCKYWLEGRCTRNQCKFLHSSQAKPNAFKTKNTWKNPGTLMSPPIERAQREVLKNNSPPIERAQRKVLKNKENRDPKSEAPTDQKMKLEAPTDQKMKIEALTDQKMKIEALTDQKMKSEAPTDQKMNSEEAPTDQKNAQKLLTSEVDAGQSISMDKKHKLCNDWVTENCTKGEKCDNLHSWFYGDGLSMVARLEGHTKDVTGIVLPSGSDKLYCGSKDKTLRVWDCNSGQCEAVVNFDEESGALVKEGPWIFAGLRDMIKAWNLETQKEVIIQASGGQVNAITMSEDILFAGMEDGNILWWKYTSETSFSEAATSLKGHTGSVLSLVVGAKMLFSSSVDHTIRVWDLESLECIHVLKGHTDDVTTVLCWDHYLLSGSLDKTIKVWASTKSGNIEEIYLHNVDDGVLAFCGMHDEERKPVLLCSLKDNGVCLYDLPSFVERGRIYSRRDIEAIQIGPEGLIFTGDESGLVSVWKLNEESVNKSY